MPFLFRKCGIFFRLSKEKSNCLLRNPAVNETVWRGLLQDLLDMQQNVYTCLKDETCHQVRKTTAKQNNHIYVHPPLLSSKLFPG